MRKTYGTLLYDRIFTSITYTKGNLSRSFTASASDSYDTIIIIIIIIATKLGKNITVLVKSNISRGELFSYKRGKREIDAQSKNAMAQNIM